MYEKSKFLSKSTCFLVILNHLRQHISSRSPSRLFLVSGLYGDTDHNGYYRSSYCCRFLEDIALVTPNISQAESVLADFDDAYGKIGLKMNPTKTMFMRSGWVPDAPFSRNGTTISECSSCVYRSTSHYDERIRSRALAGGESVSGSIEDAVKKTKNTIIRAHLFNTTVLPALTYASETWALRKQDENAASVIERSIRLTQVRAEMRSSTLRPQSKIRDAAVYAKLSKIRWAGHAP
ncbi:hypothetical protein Y032_0015g2602 [Ancylostoma ceylanicum]|uniref:Reverse transcriptase domain-containing protein n=1 Tax=Ancylostoma ceylanicum TaxID=53326 RepID=A0A016V7S8_9BILA|nr:hypothetical protein Y032_0015g2602 [Ancylostoma ceylanicum]